jgi:uncharacterized protein YkwD
MFVPLHKRALFTALLAVVVLLAAAPVASAKRCKHAGAQPSTVRHRVVVRSTLCLLNHVRARRGLRRLHLHRRLGRAARSHSADMARRGYFSHNTLSGGSFLDRIRHAGYLRHARQWMVGENIAWGTGRLATPRAIVRAWMHSPGHRANILNGRFREIGVGITYNAPVHVAGRPAATYTTDFGFRG